MRDYSRLPGEQISWESSIVFDIGCGGEVTLRGSVIS